MPVKYQVLDRFELPADYSNSRPTIRWFFWIVFGDLLMSSWLPGSLWRRILLRIFGASIGHGVLLKPNIKIKFPWHLCVGENLWIGENVWIDNLAHVEIGSNVCISQGVYLCTGNHNFKIASFPYRLGRIDIEDEVWICAMVRIAPSVRVGRGSVIEFGSVVYDSIPSGMIAKGIPAVPIRRRDIT
ncbi:WcaF family extracellular polysaccharide biosynthesis acetyltransferase [Synechococcus sp. CBW1108]|uniref:WcaF family extracellular polysaccharide biosynthesis acetyltransferase n=1 Tax=Synechococcus sp. CBW1108 TaxID=1353147 RepID=UPI0018CD7979|nr:WcaF family extracellular polysaccharide biosynthesis acetyltransferase [Synechococcus sp. CBW1108]QPN71180.1 colanic acid biosynthesis acetyltransferase WcaF [Synechococcus sp. CBW1108]